MPVRRVEREFRTLEDGEDARAAQAALTEPEPGTISRNEGEGTLAGGATPALGSELDLSASVPTETPDVVEPSHSEDARPLRGSIKFGEWAALILLGVLLLAAAIGAYFWTIGLLPEKTPTWQSVTFPVKGARIEIKQASTYWRAPVLEGPDKDSIRRGTRLIPAVDLEFSGGPAAVRVIFRDEEGRSVGDPILRAVPSSGTLSLASTAGFEDPGMHAAYRTEEIKPWSVEISEAASTTSPGASYSLLLKMNVSSELR